MEGGHGDWRLCRIRFLALDFLAPTLVGLAVFTYYPAAQNFFLGTQLARRGVANTAFICLDNFASLIASRLQDAHYYILSDGFIWHAENARYLAVFANSVFFSVFIVIVANVLGLAIALLASQKIRGASVYRTLMIWPYAISGVVVGIVFAILLGGGGSGFMNQVLRLFGVEPVPFLSDAWWARVSVGMAAAWNKLGFNVLIYIAALQSVPLDLMEAASIDGAMLGALSACDHSDDFSLHLFRRVSQPELQLFRSLCRY